MTQPPERRAPTALELAWGTPDGGRRGPRPARSLAEVIDAAIAIADGEGIEAVTMQRVAAGLGFSTMAVYRYVAGKDDLVTLMVDAAIPPPPGLPRPESGWRPGLEAWARALLEPLREHPWISRVPIAGPPMLPNQVSWMEAALRCLAGTGLSGGEQIGVLTLLSGYVRSHHLLYEDLTRASRNRGRSLPESERHQAELLASVVDPARFPRVAAAFAEAFAGPPDDEDAALQADFEFGLGRILDGVAALVEQRRAG